MRVHAKVFAQNPDEVIERALEVGEEFFHAAQQGPVATTAIGFSAAPYRVRVVKIEPILGNAEPREEGPATTEIQGFEAEVVISCSPWSG